jgi:hypothetical protein
VRTQRISLDLSDDPAHLTEGDNTLRWTTFVAWHGSELGSEVEFRIEVIGCDAGTTSLSRSAASKYERERESAEQTKRLNVERELREREQLVICEHRVVNAKPCVRQAQILLIQNKIIVLIGVVFAALLSDLHAAQVTLTNVRRTWHKDPKTNLSYSPRLPVACRSQF